MAGTSRGVGIMGGVDMDAVRRMVEQSCAAQGLPIKISSPKVVQTVTVLLGPVTTAIRGASGVSVNRQSQPPHWLRSGGVDDLDSAAAGMNDNVFEDRSDDRSLPVEVESSPLAS